MTWIWARSGGRTIVAILYGFGITRSAILLGNQVVFADARFSFLGNVAGVAAVAGFALRPLTQQLSEVACRCT